MYTLICAGGSGQKVLESAIHLCAAGLGPTTLRVLAVDPDQANGNLERVQKLVEHYIKCQAVFRERLGKKLTWFGTEIEVISRDEKGALRVWSPVGIQDRLRDIINYDNLASTKSPTDLVSLLFSDDQLNMPLGGGFRGQPNVGAAAFGLTFLHKDTEPWSLLLEKMKGEMDQPGGSKVFLAGSIFGGTGASAIHPLARFLRAQFADKDKDRLVIGAAALVPYFRFQISAATGGRGGSAVQTGPMARSDNFSLCTQAALEFYDYLRRNGDWPFDHVSVIGDSGMMDVEFSLFGAEQRNNAHHVELIAALSALHFLSPSPHDPKTKEQVRYSGPRANVAVTGDGINPLDWQDVPLSGIGVEQFRESLLAFWVAGTSHMGFYDDVVRHQLLDVKPECVPWYYERFTLKNQSLKTEPATKQLDLLNDYFGLHFFPWWRHVLGTESAEVRLFNADSLGELRARDGSQHVAPRIADLANLDWPHENDRRGLANLDKYFEDTAAVRENDGGESGVAAYLSILGLSAQAFVAREYRRVGDSATGN